MRTKVPIILNGRVFFFFFAIRKAPFIIYFGNGQVIFSTVAIVRNTLTRIWTWLCDTFSCIRSLDCIFIILLTTVYVNRNSVKRYTNTTVYICVFCILTTVYKRAKIYLVIRERWRLFRRLIERGVAYGVHNWITDFDYSIGNYKKHKKIVAPSRTWDDF